MSNENGTEDTAAATGPAPDAGPAESGSGTSAVGTQMEVLLAALREIAKDEDCQYGFFPGGDPRKFSPDSEDCTEAERAAHKEACRIWDEAESAGRSMNPEEPSGSWLASDDGKAVMHILKANFGIGTYSYSTYAAQLARAALAKATSGSQS